MERNQAKKHNESKESVGEVKSVIDHQEEDGSKAIEFEINMVDDSEVKKKHTLFDAFYYKSEYELGFKSNFNFSEIGVYNKEKERINIELTTDSKL